MGYERQELIASGGMGEVYRAWDPTLERWVALKFLHRQSPDLVERLFREARAQARIDHPDVCRVYEVGEDADGRAFIAMQLVDGRPLDEAAGEMTLEERVEVVRRVAEALHHAHGLGVIHRDVKPGNILVERDPDGGWKPYVVDFGIAREAAAAGATRTGEVMGTPAYMAPEQARGEIRRIDRRTDVYSLGAVLYELLAGRPPFDDESEIGVLLKVVDETPRSPRTIDPAIPRDLELVTLHCLEKAPQHRYPTARALADDLRRYLRGEPVTARPVGMPTRVVRYCMRHRTLTAIAALLLVVGCVAAVVHTVQLERESARADAARADAEALLGFLLDEVAEGLAPLGRLDLLERVAREAATYYERFEPEELDHAQALRAAAASAALAQVLEQRGRHEPALAAYRRGLEQLDAGGDKEALETTRVGMSIATRIAALLQELGDLDGALAEHDRAMALLHSRSPSQQEALAGVESDLERDRSWVLLELGDHEGALEAAGRGLAIVERRPEAARTDPAMRHRLAVLESLTGLVLRERGDLPEAVRWLGRARDDLAGLHRDHPEDPTYAAELQLAQGRIGDAFALAGRTEEAAEAYRQGIEIGRRLVEHDPLVVGWQRELAFQLAALGEIVHADGDVRRALELYRDSLACSRVLARVAPESPSAQNDLAWDLVQVGRAMRDLGDHAAARERWLEAVGVIGPVIGDNPSLYVLDTYATALLELDRVDEARQVVRRLREEEWFSPDLAALCRRHGLAVEDG